MFSDREILYGVAVADAVGNPLEFRSYVTRKDVRDSCGAALLRVSDDTQMTMFLYEALSLYADYGPADLHPRLVDAYSSWFYTQTTKRVVNAGLLAFPEMYSVEAPGRTCMGSMYSLTEGKTVSNTSKGNGTVMRCSPIALIGVKNGWSCESAVLLAMEDAQITHKHPYAGMSSMFLVGMYYRLWDGYSIDQAVQMTAKQLNGVVAPVLIDTFVSMLSRSCCDAAYNRMGGWVAEEALALAIGAVKFSSSYRMVLDRSICISGDSDTVGGIAGGLAAACGMHPSKNLMAKINVKAPLEWLLTR